MNLHRRQLDKSQLAMVALEAEKYIAEEKKLRQVALAGTRPNKSGSDLEEHLPQGSRAAQARDEAAALVGVSGKLVALEAEKYLAEEAKERMAANQFKDGKPPARTNLSQPSSSKARDEAAALVGVSGMSVQTAKPPQTLVENLSQVKAHDKAAALVGVSGKLVSDANFIARPVSPALPGQTNQRISLPIPATAPVACRAQRAAAVCHPATRKPPGASLQPQ